MTRPAFRRLSPRAAPRPAEREPGGEPCLPPVPAGRARVVAVIDQGARGARAFSWACGHAARTPGAMLQAVVVDTTMLRFLPPADVACGPLPDSSLTAYHGPAEQLAALARDATHHGVTAHLAYSDHALCQVIDAVLDLRPDLVVAGFGGHRARSLGGGLLGRVVRRGTPLVVIS